MTSIGERFTVETPQEVRDKNGALVARYIPGVSYRVTPRNIAFVRGLAAGEARAAQSNVQSAPARSAGSMTVKARKGSS